MRKVYGRQLHSIERMLESRFRRRDKFRAVIELHERVDLTPAFKRWIGDGRLDHMW